MWYGLHFEIFKRSKLKKKKKNTTTTAKGKKNESRWNVKPVSLWQSGFTMCTSSGGLKQPVFFRWEPDILCWAGRGLSHRMDWKGNPADSPERGRSRVYTPVKNCLSTGTSFQQLSSFYTICLWTPWASKDLGVEKQVFQKIGYVWIWICEAGGGEWHLAIRHTWIRPGLLASGGPAWITAFHLCFLLGPLFGSSVLFI